VTVRSVAGCAICAAGRGQAGACGSGMWRLAYVDDAMIAFVRPDASGVLVAPRAHGAVLDASPELSGPVLAGTRRAVLAIRSLWRTADATVAPLTGVPGSSGHACYRVDVIPPTERRLGADQVGRLAMTLRRHLARATAPAAGDRLW
jgi:hypothetical protein